MKVNITEFLSQYQSYSVVVVVSSIVCVFSFLAFIGFFVSSWERKTKKVEIVFKVVSALFAILFVISVIIVSSYTGMREQERDTFKQELSLLLDEGYGFEVSGDDKFADPIINSNRDTTVVIQTISKDQGKLEDIRCVVEDGVLMFFDEDGYPLELKETKEG